MADLRPIAFFDSGLGGISVLRETVRLWPAPYGVALVMSPWNYPVHAVRWTPLIGRHRRRATPRRGQAVAPTRPATSRGDCEKLHRA